MTEQTGRILLLGASGVGKHTLLRAITEQDSVQRGATSYPWRLDNKYYTADVQFEVRHVNDHELQGSQLQLDDSGYEALLLVFDGSRKSSFDSVQRWYEAAGGGEAELGVKLAVCARIDAGSLSLGAGGEAGKPSWLVAAEEWCAEQLVELVEADAQAAAGAAQAQQPGAAAAAAAAAASSGEGASGVPRIREALAAHMWSGMQMKPSPRHGAAAAAAATVAAQQPASAAAAPVAAAPVAAANGNADGVHSSGSSADTGEGFSLADYLRAAEDTTAAAGPAAGGPPAVGSRPPGGGGEDDEGEVEQMEQLFSQLSSHRGRLAQLPDSQRREAAAAMVMQLMAAMGLEGDDDDEAGEAGHGGSSSSSQGG